MRRVYSTITPSVVRREAQHCLRKALPLEPYGRSVTALALSSLLLLIAATGSSLSALVRRFGFGFSHETARQAVLANLPADLATLTKGLVAALHECLSFSRRDRRRTWDVAIDTHYCPYYGNNPKQTPGVVGGQKKHGTKYFYAYATAVLLHRRRRYTVALLPLTGKIQPHQIVAALLTQITARGLTLRGVVLDCGFDSGATIVLLQQQGLSYTIPLGRRGKGQTNNRNVCFTRPVGTVGELTWTADRPRQKVRTSFVVWRRPGQPEVKVYAFGGWGSEAAVSAQRRARQARRKYRQRFGIETSYRQKNQAQGRTTAKGVAYRLLVQGLALLLRQVWVRLTEQIARARQAKPTAWIGELPLQVLLDWLADALKGRYKESKSIPLEPLPRPTF